MATKPKQIDEAKLMKRLQKDMKGKNPMKEWAVNKDALVKKYNVPGPFLFRKLDELLRQQKSANTVKSVDQMKAEKKSESLLAEEKKIREVKAQKAKVKAKSESSKEPKK